MAERWEDYFEPGETLLWEGAPMERAPMTPVTIGLAVFGMPFFLGGVAMTGGALLALFGVTTGLAEAAGTIFVFFFGLPFLGIGAGLVIGPFYAARNAHRKVRYALSDRRAYIASRWWTRKLETLPIAPASTISIKNGRDVYFHTEIGRDSDGDRTTEEKGFENIAEADKVYHLLRQIQSAAEAGGDG